MSNVKDLSFDIFLLLFHMVDNTSSWFLCGILFSVLRKLDPLASMFILSLHDTILDLQCDKNGIMDTFIRQKRAGKRIFAIIGYYRPTNRMAFVFKFFSHSGACSSLYPFYDSSNFQLNDKNR